LLSKQSKQDKLEENSFRRAGRARFNAPDLKSDVGSNLPGVRIPRSPPYYKKPRIDGAFCVLALLKSKTLPQNSVTKGRALMKKTNTSYLYQYKNSANYFFRMRTSLLAQMHYDSLGSHFVASLGTSNFDDARRIAGSMK
jgi:hypothetical protein